MRAVELTGKKSFYPSRILVNVHYIMAQGTPKMYSRRKPSALIEAFRLYIDIAPLLFLCWLEWGRFRTQCYKRLSACEGRPQVPPEESMQGHRYEAAVGPAVCAWLTEDQGGKFSVVIGGRYVALCIRIVIIFHKHRSRPLPPRSVPKNAIRLC